MTEPQPLPENAREELQNKPFIATCPQGHSFSTGSSMWDIRVLSEQTNFGGNFLNLTCPQCHIDFTLSV